MNKLDGEILTKIRALGPNAMPGAYSEAATEVAIKWIEDFKDWYDTLSPAEKCTVWPPAGSGAGTGLYNMQTKDLVDKFITKKSKEKSEPPNRE
jgi:hypothetical protein